MRELFTGECFTCLNKLWPQFSSFIITTENIVYINQTNYQIIVELTEYKLPN
jgi:hypothetical protein